MARGDYAVIKLRTPVGVDETKLRAELVGGSINVSMPQRAGELFVHVDELNQAGKPVRQATFLATETLSVVEGHEQIVTKIRVGPK